MTTPLRSLRIENAWDGSPLPPEHWITLHLLEYAGGIEIRVQAPFYGDPSAPRVPVGPTDNLWEYEVVELFILGPDEQYTEIELAPAGHHLVLTLDGSLLRGPRSRQCAEATSYGSLRRNNAQELRRTQAYTRPRSAPK